MEFLKALKEAKESGVDVKTFTEIWHLEAQHKLLQAQQADRNQESTSSSTTPSLSTSSSTTPSSSTSSSPTSSSTTVKQESHSAERERERETMTSYWSLVQHVRAVYQRRSWQTVNPSFWSYSVTRQASTSIMPSPKIWLLDYWITWLLYYLITILLDYLITWLLDYLIT